MDMSKSIPPDSSLEIVEVNHAPHPYDKFMDDIESSNP